MRGVMFVFDLAVGQSKTWEEFRENEVESARRVAQAGLHAGIKRLVYTGTIDSYYAGLKAGTITAQTPLDPDINRRNWYARAKAEAENVLMDAFRKAQLPVTIFRPGIVIGRGASPFHWGVGRFTENVCEVWGDGNNPLPFVLVADVARALIRGIEVPGIEGRSYNLVDAPLLSAREYLRELENRSGLKLQIEYRPIWKFYVADLIKWIVKVIVRHPGRFRVPSYSDWESRTQRAHFDCANAVTELGWQPAGTKDLLLTEGIGGALEEWQRAVE
jgi:nucleoside-diphosphate-sugar epimerase